MRARVAVLTALLALAAAPSALADSKPNGHELWRAYPLKPSASATQAATSARTATATPTAARAPANGGGGWAPIALVALAVVAGAAGAAAVLRRKRRVGGEAPAAAPQPPGPAPAAAQPAAAAQPPAASQPPAPAPAAAQPRAPEAAPARRTGRFMRRRRFQPSANPPAPAPAAAQPAAPVAAASQPPAPAPAAAQPRAPEAAPARRTGRFMRRRRFQPSANPPAEPAERRFAPVRDTRTAERLRAAVDMQLGRQWPWPEGSEGLWRCEIGPDQAALSARFRAVLHPPDGEPPRVLAVSSAGTARGDWQSAAPIEQAVNGLAAQLVADGWEPVEGTGDPHTRRFCWRHDRAPHVHLQETAWSA